MLLEYKIFEPGFYTMDVPDWGTSLVHCLALGSKANVLVDTGHHAPGTNIEFIVASLLRLGRLGGFHFNSRFYADDDLLVGAADPYQLFRILAEVVAVGAHRQGSGVAFMLDQCHNVEDKVAGGNPSVMNVQEATAKALLVDRGALKAAQDDGDVLGAHCVLNDAFNSDVRPLLAELRGEMGIDADPLAAYARSGYPERIRSSAQGVFQSGGGAEAMATSAPGPPRPSWSELGKVLYWAHHLGKRELLGLAHGAGPGDRPRRPSSFLTEPALAGTSIAGSKAPVSETLDRWKDAVVDSLGKCGLDGEATSAQPRPRSQACMTHSTRAYPRRSWPWTSRAGW